MQFAITTFNGLGLGKLFLVRLDFLVEHTLRGLLVFDCGLGDQIPVELVKDWTDEPDSGEKEFAD